MFSQVISLSKIKVALGDEGAWDYARQTELLSRYNRLYQLRDGPLEKLWGGGRGIFEPQEFFFAIKFLV